MCLPVMCAKANCGPETHRVLLSLAKKGALQQPQGRMEDVTLTTTADCTCEVQTESTLPGPSAGQGLFKDFQLETMERSGIGDGGQH